MRPLLCALPDNEAFLRLLARDWPADEGVLEVHRFPDGESKVRFIDAPEGRDVALVCTLRDPDKRLWPLLTAVETARELGAASVGLVAPYLAYLRQDRSFVEGEGITARHFARELSEHFDWLVTVDPHLHRVHDLGELYTIPASAVSAAPAMAQWVATHVSRPVLVGPDAESEQWVARIAAMAHAPHVILQKDRQGDRQVRLTLPDIARWKEHVPVIVDDIISSGGTLIETVRQLREQGLKPPVCLAVHAVFAQWAYWGLLEAGAAQVVTTNSIEHATNGVDIAPAVAAESRTRVVQRAPVAGAA